MLRESTRYLIISTFISSNLLFAFFRQGVFPFKEYELDLLAEKNTVNMFIRTLMRKLFSDDYLATKSCSLMEKKHHDAITGIFYYSFCFRVIIRFI